MAVHPAGSDQRTGFRVASRIDEGQIDPSFVITHTASLEEGPGMYRVFEQKQDSCIKVVLKP